MNKDSGFVLQQIKCIMMQCLHIQKLYRCVHCREVTDDYFENNQKTDTANKVLAAAHFLISSLRNSYPFYMV